MEKKSPYNIDPTHFQDRNMVRYRYKGKFYVKNII